VPLDLGEAEIIKLYEIYSNISVVFVKTSTSYRFIKQLNRDYNYKGVTIKYLELIKKHVTRDIRIKATRGVRTLDDLLRVIVVGVLRVGATTIRVILDKAIRRGIRNKLVEVTVPLFPTVSSTLGGY
jgi:deoxyribose-phosphate aldolase